MRLEGPVDLAATLQGGQAFRWRRHGEAFVGAVGRRLVSLAPSAAGGVEARAFPRAPRALFERYLRLEPDDAARRARLARDPVLAPALRAFPGLRLLRQDPWETTAAFLTSANNNVLRIEGILDRLAQRWGDPIHAPEDPTAKYAKDAKTPVPSRASRTSRQFSFPRPDAIARASERELRAVGLGYRAPFLRETARRAARMDLASLRGKPLAEVREALLDLPGVGPKVADCIALFSLDADDAFPVDRWVLRVMAETFPELGEAPRPRDVEAFARERWGRDAGLAQQVLFHAVRVRRTAPGTRRLARPAG